MCELNENGFEHNERFKMGFNQDYTNLSVIGTTGYRFFHLTAVDRIDEFYSSIKSEDTKICERLYNSKLLAIVGTAEPNKIRLLHFLKEVEICHFNYSAPVVAVRMNRSRLVVCLANTLYVYTIREMKQLAKIELTEPNTSGLIALSWNCQLAYPKSNTTGTVQIYEARKPVKKRMEIQAHESPLAAISFSPSGKLLATASEKGTVIRVFCVKNGQRVHEFRRGVKRYVHIASLNFSDCSNYVCVSSNTETIHIFKIDNKMLETVEQMDCINSCTTSDGSASKDGSSSETDVSANVTPTSGEINENKDGESCWTMGYITKAMTSYFPSRDVFSQDRAFATAQLSQAGLRYECFITQLKNYPHMLAACEDGFLYIYSFDTKLGGECKLLRVHDLRNTLFGITEINMDMDSLVISPEVEETAVIDDDRNGSYAAIVRGSEKTEQTVVPVVGVACAV